MAQSNLKQDRFAAWIVDLVLSCGLGVLTGGAGWPVSLAYWLLKDGLFEGQSIGKRVMGLKVVMGKDQANCNYIASVLRNVLWIVPFINLLMACSGFYAVFINPLRGHWGDRLAETRVVYALRA
jgi:uncharacterized RDD family membrane protein YckC